ncbi:transposase [Nocardia vinacea]|uniref:transposase n=1 Tax=Nocardia vinacea TaxID=96468 RepID=UPI0034384973
MTPVQRLTEILGIGPGGAQAILAEIGLDMTRFPTAVHLVSWAKLCPRTVQSGALQRAGRTGATPTSKVCRRSRRLSREDQHLPR